MFTNLILSFFASCISLTEFNEVHRETSHEYTNDKWQERDDGERIGNTRNEKDERRNGDPHEYCPPDRD